MVEGDDARALTRHVPGVLVADYGGDDRVAGGGVGEERGVEGGGERGEERTVRVGGVGVGEGGELAGDV